MPGIIIFVYSTAIFLDGCHMDEYDVYVVEKNAGQKSMYTDCQNIR